MKLSAPAKRTFAYSLGGALLLSCAPAALHAETSNADLAKQIAELKHQINAMKGTIAKRKVIREVVVKTAVPSYTPSIPVGATPVFVTADKKMQFGSLTITPGGFIDADFSYRTKSTGSDYATAFAGIPFGNNSAGHTGESRIEARQSRAALLIESPIAKNTVIAAYGEIDFGAAGTSSNITQTTAFVPRMRNAYTTLDFNDYGFHVLAGQNWSLITLNSKGITPRNEVLPPGIDPGTFVGADYGRIPQIRIVKDFDKKLWLALSIEAAGGTPNGACGSLIANTGAAFAPGFAPQPINGVLAGSACQSIVTSGAGGNGLSQQITLNQVPDVLAKIAYEARIFDRDVHIEALGAFREFTTNVQYGVAGVPAGALTGVQGASNQNATGYGVGYGILAPIIPTKLDFESSGEYGRGLGRYTSSGLPDATVLGTGRPSALLGFSANAGFIYHATPALDFYAFAGIDQVNRNYSVDATGAEVGYGAPNAGSNLGCNVQGGACSGATRRVVEVAGGLTDKIYKGAFGQVNASIQFEYIQRQIFASTAAVGAANGLVNTPLVGARANDQIVYTSLRYFPFQ